MKFISWNVRGLHDLDKCNRIRTFFKDYNIDIALLQETKIECPDYRLYRSLGGFHFHHWLYLPARGSAGGLLVGWRDSSVKLLQSIINIHSLHFIFLDLSDNSILNVSNVYGPNSKVDRRGLWSECLAFRSFSVGPWVVGGDFNVTRFLGERTPREGDFSAMEEFDQFIVSGNLIELPLCNRRFTWSNGRETPSLALLDRFFISDEMEDRFPLCKVLGLPFTYSDHCPIILHCNNLNLVHKTFRFEKMWLLENNFLGMVTNKWTSLSYLNDRFFGNIAKIFVTKLRELRLFLKKWNKDVFGNVKVRK